jgi:uncharacterized membrane protein YgcG
MNESGYTPGHFLFFLRSKIHLVSLVVPLGYTNAMKLIKYFFVIVVIFFGMNAYAERIHNFDTTVQINSDASISVTEVIEYDFENLYRHGIFRFIPLQYMVNGSQGEDGNIYRMDINIQSVQRDGLPEPFTIEQNNNQISIKIGSPNKKITGNHVYTINYDVTGALRYFDSYDELYWNATGSQWEVPIDTASVVLKSEVVMFDNYYCYSGPVNSQNACEQKSNNNNNLFFSQKNLGPQQGLTIAASFDKGIPVVQNLVTTASKYERSIFSFFSRFWLPILATLFIFISGFRVRAIKRKHYYKQSVVTQYEPMQNLNPMFTGYIMDFRFDPHDITAGIIYAAQQGYLTIKYIPKPNWYSSDDYIFTINQKKYDSMNTIPDDVMFILTLIFRKGDYQDFTALFKNPRELESIEFITQRRLNELKSESTKRLSEKKKIVKYFEQNLIERNILEKTASKIIRFTRIGWETQYYLKGFKRFLSMTEKDRYEFHNNIKNTGETFMEYLPYAIAFRVEKKWAQQFKDITIEQPDWYQGNQPGSLAIASSLNNFSRAVTSSVTPPKRSGSGSGSSGGGSSGGGSGGGGGGSW